MLNSIKDVLGLTTSAEYPYTDPRRYTSWLSRGENYWWVVGGVALTAAALLVIRRLRQNRVEYPNAQLETSLNIGRLTIAVPEKKRPPLDVSLIFCIDTSGSMKDKQREAQVKKGVGQVLDRVERILSDQPEARVRVAIVGFNDQPYRICEPTEVSTDTWGSLRDALKGYKSSGKTDIVAGLGEAIQVAKEEVSTTRALILLSDGEEKIDQSRIDAMRLTAANVNHVFAIGIGKGHHRTTLAAIAAAGKGDYIDTTLKGQTIPKAIRKSYQQAIARCTGLNLQTPGEGRWRVDGTKVKKGVADLGELAEGDKKVVRIELDSARLDTPLDLSKIDFLLRFRDSQGNEGGMQLPWNPSTIVDPDILSIS